MVLTAARRWQLWNQRLAEVENDDPARYAYRVVDDPAMPFLRAEYRAPLATTDPDKLPETIASRCQRFYFRRIPRDGMVSHMRRVADREGERAVILRSSATNR